MYEGDKIERFTELPTNKQKELCDWIKNNVSPIKTINGSISSYGMKHICENECCDGYVMNGEFKGAMLVMGYEPHDITAQNWYFRISKKSPCFKRK